MTTDFCEFQHSFYAFRIVSWSVTKGDETPVCFKLSSLINGTFLALSTQIGFQIQNEAQVKRCKALKNER